MGRRTKAKPIEVVEAPKAEEKAVKQEAPVKAEGNINNKASLSTAELLRLAIERKNQMLAEAMKNVSRQGEARRWEQR
jgi:hypothetical protein